jgi:hypothetical protein
MVGGDGGRGWSEGAGVSGPTFFVDLNALSIVLDLRVHAITAPRYHLIHAVTCPVVV